MNIALRRVIGKARHGDLDDLKRKKIVGYRGNIAVELLNKIPRKKSASKTTL